MARVRGSRNAPYESTVQGAFDDAKCVFEELRDEIGEWRDNLDSNGMDHLPKYEEVSEAAEYLDNGFDTLDCIDLSELGDAVENLPVKTTQDTRRKASSRSYRAGNAIALLYVAKEELEAFGSLDTSFDAAGEAATEEAIEKADELAEEAKSMAGEIGNAIDELESVEYPGMFG